jgi:hypothetical protein
MARQNLPLQAVSPLLRLEFGSEPAKEKQTTPEP